MADSPLKTYHKAEGRGRKHTLPFQRATREKSPVSSKAGFHCRGDHLVEMHTFRCAISLRSFCCAASASTCPKGSGATIHREGMEMLQLQMHRAGARGGPGQLQEPTAPGAAMGKCCRNPALPSHCIISEDGNAMLPADARISLRYAKEPELFRSTHLIQF